MHVVQVSHVYHPSFGGIENYVARLNESLEADGHTTETVTTDASFGGGPRTERANTVYCETTLSVFRNPLSVELFAHLRGSDADVYHLHSPWFLPSLEAVLALPDDAPVVMTIHGVHLPREGLLSKLLPYAYWPVAQYILSRVDRVVVLGQPERKRLHDHFFVDDDRVAVVPNGIDPAEYDVPEADVDDFRETYDIDPDVPVALYVGRLVSSKQPDRFVDAVADHLPDTEVQALVIGKGDDEYVTELKERADDRTRFLADLSFSELKAAYHAADVFVSIGTSEGLPTVLLEAMNARLPVVATPAGATADVVADPENGRVLAPHPTPSAVAAAVRQYLENPEERRIVGERNRDVVRERFTWDRVYADLARVYADLTGAERPASTDGG
ncbi:glycosyltransferase family 4 protein [Halocalculus aciditolerans]|uniref:Glycosyl transferase family 1 n=1 Tax=Halocalculus aciditolerans TaxID=1383812 RepID=A0A830F2G3_9EURY|nr:glycosyltransferase family 4 protein [Halocalculus aciditolerans]GGL55962.1 glycosyl transferase family 1 [Halocalculus aciditolerans]